MKRKNNKDANVKILIVLDYIVLVSKLQAIVLISVNVQDAKTQNNMKMLENL